jgi:hypothetical protein
VPLGYLRTSDKLVSIGSIAGTGLASISAASSDLVGGGIALTGPLGSLVVRDIANGTGIQAGGTAAQQTTIRARWIGDGGEIRLGSTLASLVTQEIGAVRITAAAVGSIYATGGGQSGSSRSGLAGNFAANLDVKGNVDLVSVAGTVRGVNWNIGGRLGKLVAAEVGAGRIAAGAVGSLASNGNARFGLAGDCAADLYVKGKLTTATIAGRLNAAAWVIGGDLQTLIVRGAIDGLTMTVGGTLTTAQLGTVHGAAFDVGRRVVYFTSSTFTGSYMYVGYTPLNPADPMADATSSRFTRDVVSQIYSFRVITKTKDAFSGSTIAARQICYVTLSCVESDSLRQFGVLADDSIRSVVVETPKLFRVFNRMAPDNVGIGQFRVRIV